LDRELPEKRSASPENSMDIDLGAEKFATPSSGIAIGGPHFMEKVEERAKKIQEQLSGRRKGSRNYEKQMVKVGPVRPEFAPVEIAASDLHGLCPYEGCQPLKQEAKMLRLMSNSHNRLCNQL